MSLKEEQILRNYYLTEKQPQIYSTGVYLVLMKISMRGIDQFIWVADEFSDDSFDDEGDLIDPFIISNALERMYKKGVT